MAYKKSIRFFNDRSVRAVWDEEHSKWWFSAIDIVRAINDEDDYKKCRNYWKYLKGKMAKEGVELVSITNHFKFEAPDGKQRASDALDTQCVQTLAKHYPANRANAFLDWFIYSDNTVDGQSKKKAYDLFESGLLNTLEPGTVQCLLISEADAKKRIKEVEQLLIPRIMQHMNNPKFKRLAQKMDELREKMAQNLKTSIEFLKDILQLAKEVLEAEKDVKPVDNRERAKAALTELFQSIKNPETRIIVENVVNDIDQKVVAIVRNFNDVFQTVSGKKEVQRQLRSILWLKYKIKDQEVFDKAYSYIEMYY